MSHDLEAPSEWVRRWARLVRPGGRVLDVACGAGRHSRFLAGLGLRVLGVDRDPGALAGVAGVELRVADLEGGPWPLGDERFDGVVVTNYLHRPLFPRLVEALAPGGVLIYETFALGNERFGKPSNPDFLLRPGELLTLVEGLRVVAYEDGFATPPERCVQRIVAVREAGPAADPKRRRL